MAHKIQIKPDRNCFYRNISDFLYNTENQFELIRLAIYSYALSNKTEINYFQTIVKLINGKFVDTITYIKI